MAKTALTQRLEAAPYSEAIKVARIRIPFGIQCIHLEKMSYWQNQFVLSSFWNYAWFNELFESMTPAEILSALYGSSILKRANDFKLQTEGIRAFVWKTEMSGLEESVINAEWKDALQEKVYWLIHESNRWGYEKKEIKGKLEMMVPMIFALQSQAAQRPGDEERRVKEAARKHPQKAFTLVQSILLPRVLSNLENPRNFGFTVIDADGFLENKPWYVNMNYGKLLALATAVPQAIKEAAA